MLPHFQLLTLGVPQLLTATGEAVRYRTRKHFALLIRLALEPGKRLAREYLIDLLWPEAPRDHGRHSLSQAITVLRATIGRQFLAAQRATLALAEGAVEVDAHRLEACQAQIRGRFLEGFELRGARGFEEWREAWAARLYPRIRDCLVRQMDAGRRVGDFAKVEQHALLLEEFDPLSEDAVRGIMEARAWVGDRSNALKAFSRFATRLAEDLGAKPSPELVRIADLLREGRRPAPRPTEGGVPPREERRFEAETIIGREREFSVLYDAWLEVRQRKPRVMVLLGDPGIGKTTLTNAFVSSCQMEGAVIARAQAYDAERELPYGVLAELVRQLTLQRSIGAAEPEALAELSRLTPEIFSVFPGVEKPSEWPPEVVPLRLADGFLKAVTAAADDNPVVLVVDDIHAADDASVAILHMLARKLAGLRLQLIVTARPAELRLAGPPGALTTDSTIDGLVTVDLESLPKQSAEALVARLGGRGGSQQAEPPVQRILRASAGNPLAIELLMREWSAHGEGSLLGQLEALDTQPTTAPGIPIAIRTVFERQTRRLDTRTRGVLTLAAVLGRRLGDLRLYSIVGCAAGEAAVHLSTLLAAGLVREVRGELEFRNELIRAQAYYDVAEPVRRQLHRQIADSLDAAMDSKSAGFRLEVAWHFLRGGDLQRALPHALLGAEACILTGAPSEAEQTLAALLRNRLDDCATRRVRLLLAKALVDQSKAAPSIPILETLLTDGDLTQEDLAEGALLRARAEYMLNRESGRGYGVAASFALRTARRSGDPRLIIRALFESARAGAELGDAQTLSGAHDEIKTLLRDAAYDGLSDAHYACAFCETALYKTRSAEAHILKAISLLGSSASPTKLSYVYNGLGVISHHLCKLPEATQAFRQALDLAKSIGDDSRASAIAANLCTTLTLRGDYEAALSAGIEAIRSGTKALNQPLFVSAYTNMVDAHILTGNPDMARHCLNAAKEWLRHDRSWFARVTLLVEEAGLELMTCNIDTFLNVLSALEDETSGRGPILLHEGVFAKYTAYRAIRMNMPEEALRIVSDATNRLEGCPLAHLDASAARGWVETRVLGHTNATEATLQSLNQYGMHGKCAMLAKEGFLSPTS